MMCKLRGRMDKDGHYDMDIKEGNGKGGIMIRKLKGRMDKEGHYDEEMKRSMQKEGIIR